SRRVQCVNNLKQVALAVANYHDVHGAVAPAAIATGVPDCGMKPRLLPYMEQSAVYNAYNVNVSVGDASNGSVRVLTVSTFVCPPDPNNPGGTLAVNGVSLTIGSTSYPNNIGTFNTNNGNQYDGPYYELAALNRGQTITFNLVKDGLSNTVIFSEWVRGTG